MERGIQGPLARIQPVTRNLSNTVGDSPAVIGSEGKDLQNQQVERALQEVGFWQGVPSTFERKYGRVSLGGQEDEDSQSCLAVCDPRAHVLTRLDRRPTCHGCATSG